MPTNYESLKLSEDNINTAFFNFFDHVLSYQKMFLNVLKKPNEISLDKFKKNYVFEEKSNNFEAEILDECCWTISKDMPRANHLRFIIAILNSIKDLERIADYITDCMYAVCKNIKYIDKKTINIFLEIWNKSFEVSNFFFEALKTNRKSETINFYSKKAINVKNEFDNFYQEKMEDLFDSNHKSAKKNISKKVQHDVALDSFLIFRDAQRNVDHVLNIVENFVYIREDSFFVNAKEHKKYDL